MSVSSPNDFYLNQNQYSEMKLGARNQSSETTKAVAEQFESLFVQQMLASMRSAAIIDESNHSSTVDFYQEMYDKQLSLSISTQGGGLGIAKVLLQHLPGADQSGSNLLNVSQPDTGKISSDQITSAQFTLINGNGGKSLPMGATPQLAYLAATNTPVTHVTNLPSKTPPELNLTISHRLDVKEPTTQVLKAMPSVYRTDAYQTQNPAVKVHQYQTGDLPVNRLDGEAANQVGSPQRWGKPDHFVNDLWPHAEKAANAIGISVKALVAQSALETGWGKHSMRFPDGQQAFNLFGIKAGSQWDGPTLIKPTLEFRDGVMQTEMAHFRAYDSINDALEDYVEFIQSSPRYQNALDHQGNDSHYLKQLQQGGYATDPQYANKILQIMHGPTLAGSVANLNFDQSRVKESSHA